MTTKLTIEPGQEWQVDLFRPEDAQGVVSLFLDVYGSGYPVKTYLEPDLLIKANQEARVISSVARTSRGDIVGHNALFNSAPCTRIFESGAGLVHRDYRGGHGIFRDLVVHGIQVGKQNFGVETVYGEPVLNHPFSQKMCLGQNFLSRALEVSLMPAEAYSREASATGRVSTLLDFTTLIPNPCTVYVPGAYDADFPFFYEAMDDQRRFEPSTRPLPVSPSSLETQTFPFARVARIAVTAQGKDLEAVIRSEERKLTDSGIRVFQVWLSTGDAWVGEAVDIMRNCGYFCGGVLPRWLDSDAVLMQKVLDTPDWDGMVIVADRAKELRDRVRADWERVSPDSEREAP